MWTTHSGGRETWTVDKGQRQRGEQKGTTTFKNMKNAVNGVEPSSIV